MPDCTAVVPHALHHAGCGCALPLARRGLLGSLGALTALAALPRSARAASGNYEAMLVNCIDPRFTTGSYAYMGEHHMRDRYSQFVIAGGPIGAVHARFAAWHQAFWDNLDITVALHNIHAVVALTHRDCGAAKLALGEAAVATTETETAGHAEVLRAFRAEVARRKPALQVVTGIMALDGSVLEIA
ncbi:hypothetical protein [Paracraurococcus lichenis]|uniref:Carbonic anhydrase n=1 Tax=Paracraurococcus lichenis TaxID=3064888 RepID=A0ABT9DZ50_9PROT|nr:hypothetical protein [Paracraurococcus sp. LOR1-02]MDO9709159.1 hypothetical protein [Paracraurococcus sp. LOR1-02]